MVAGHLRLSVKKQINEVEFSLWSVSTSLCLYLTVTVVKYGKVNKKYV